MSYFAADLDAVSIADHVVLKNDTAHSGKMNAAGLDRISSSLQVAFCTLCDLGFSVRLASIIEPAIGPVTMWAEDSRQFSGGGFWPI